MSVIVERKERVDLKEDEGEVGEVDERLMGVGEVGCYDDVAEFQADSLTVYASSLAPFLDAAKCQEEDIRRVCDIGETEIPISIAEYSVLPIKYPSTSGLPPHQSPMGS